MLYKEIRRRSDSFHQHPKKWDEFYSRYMRDRNRNEWDSCLISESEAQRLKRFLNQWSTHYQAKPCQIAGAVNAVLPDLNRLRGEDLLHVDFWRVMQDGQSIAHIIEQAFDTIVACGEHYESTAASKILHVVNPELFVMWDMRIRKAYRIVGGGGGLAYAHSFLPKMQRMARQAIQECMHEMRICEAEAIGYLCQHGQSLAKLMDEYNWDKYVGSVSRPNGRDGSTQSIDCPGGSEATVSGVLRKDVIHRIAARLTEAGGSANIPLMKPGRSFKAHLQRDGVEVSNLRPKPTVLPWQVFSETIVLLERQGGTARKGNAMVSGARLGDRTIPLCSVEGHIARSVYGQQTGESVFRRIAPVAALLDWCGLCVNCRGELKLVK